MQKYSNNVTNRGGQSVAGASVSVTTLAGAVATIYSDNGVTPRTNPIITDAQGEFSFYAANDHYTVTITGSNIDQDISSDIILYDRADDPSPTSATLAASGGAGLVGFIQGDPESVARTLENKLRDDVSVFDYLAQAEQANVYLRLGTLDLTASVQKAIDYAKSEGKTLRLYSGLFGVTAINTYGGTKAWAMIGDGPDACEFVRINDTAGTVIHGASTGSAVPYRLEGFKVNAKHSIYPNGNQGISIIDTPSLRIKNVHVVDYKQSSILVFATTPNTFGDCVIEDCFSDGLGVANNGMLIAEMSHSGFVRCRAVGALGTPGYGIQLKNDCRYCFITDASAEDCVVGLAFGQDTSASAVKYSQVKGFRSVGNKSGFLAGYAEYNDIQGLYVDMESAFENAIDIQGNSIGNTVRATVRNVLVTRQAVRFRTGSTDNTVRIDAFDNPNTGRVVLFDVGSDYNTVTLSRMLNPRIRSGGTTGMMTGTGTTTNSFVYDPYPAMESVVIASDAITLTNAKAQMIIVDTEATAATDNLSTIPAGEEGRIISLRTLNAARDIVVKHNVGNILLTGAADFTLDDPADTLMLRYNLTSNKWCEIGRGNNI